MKNKINSWYSNHPLEAILWVGLFFRLLAAIFSKGYGWHDDQFLIIEIAQSWVDGIDYYNWLPSADGVNVPEGFSFFYVGIHYVLLWIFDFIGMEDPQAKMFIVRLLHAFWSMPIIYFGYKVTQRLSNNNTANRVGWILSIFWIFPILSVRNLVEYTSIPFIMAGLWMVIKAKDKSYSILWWLVAGFLFGMAFNVRFQTLLITGGIGLAMLFNKQWKQTFFLAFGTLISMALVQGIIDYFVWGEPFVQFIGYVDYNLHNAANYVVSPWYTYVLFLLGILLPPVSVFIMVGYFRSWKKLFILFLPVLIFLIFHSYYPNKQERFVVTIMPMLIIAGMVGWMQLEVLWKNRPQVLKWVKGSWVFFLVLNLILLFPVSMMYSKKARVESMYYLSQYDDIQMFVIEDVNQSILRFPPQFYLNHWINYETLLEDDSMDAFTQRMTDSGKVADFVLFLQPNNLEQRVNNMKEFYPDLVYETTIDPGFMDKVIFWLNPINDNQIITIYRNQATMPHAITNAND